MTDSIKMKTSVYFGNLERLKDHRGFDTRSFNHQSIPGLAWSNQTEHAPFCTFYILCFGPQIDGVAYSGMNIPLTSLQGLDQVHSLANQSQGHYGP